MTININDLTIGEAKELAVLFNNTESKQPGLNSMVGVKAINTHIFFWGLVWRDFAKIR